MTQKNKIIAKYRILGFTIIIASLFVIAFGVLLVQERQQLEAGASTGTLFVKELR